MLPLDSVLCLLKLPNLRTEKTDNILAFLQHLRKMIDPASKNPLKLPVLDVSQPLDSSSLSSLAAACKEWGFFQIINHGVSKDLLTKIHSLSNQIFSLPSESKLKVGPFSLAQTYTPHFIASPFFESLRVSGPDFAASAQCSADALYGGHDSEFSEVVHEYGTKVTELSKTILKFVLVALGEGLATKYYESEFRKCHGYLRINNYTRQQEGVEAEGLGMHTDMSCLTIVYQDEAGGLQVRSREGKWMDLQMPCEGTLVVNIGDMLQAWSNGRLRSSEHRVMLRKPRDRMSFAFFWCFEDQKVITAPDEVVGQGTRAYRPFVCLDYLNFRQSNEEGKFEKVGFTVKDFAGIC